MENSNPDETLAVGRFLALRKRQGWEFVERTNASGIAVLVAVTDDQEAVFVEQYREPVRCRVIEWPAGLAGDEQQGESLFAAASRELEEETGFRAERFEIIERGPSSAGLTSEVVTFLRARGLRRVGAGGGAGNERIQVHLVPLDSVDRWLERRRGVGLLIDPKVYAGLYFLGTDFASGR